MTEVHLRAEGIIFWVLWAGVEAVARDPDTQAMNCFLALKALYPMAGKYDRDLIKTLRPTVQEVLAASHDQDTQYFLERILQTLPKEDE